MKKALRIGLAALAVATVGTASAIFNTAYTSEDYAAMPFVQTAVLKQGATGGEVKEVQRRLKQWGYYNGACHLYTTPRPRDNRQARIPSAA